MRDIAFVWNSVTQLREVISPHFRVTGDAYSQRIKMFKILLIGSLLGWLVGDPKTFAIIGYELHLFI